MENSNKPNYNSENDDLNLDQFIQLFKNFLDSIFKGILRIFVYFKKRFWHFAIMVVVGLAIGFGLNYYMPTKLKTEVIVKPNLESKTYLYEVVESIAANLKVHNESFFDELDIDISDLKNFEIEVETIKIDQIENINDEVKYLDILQKFKDEETILDVAREEIVNKANLQHLITFYYIDAATGQDAAGKLMDYINSNDYYSELVKIYSENAAAKIKVNDGLVQQIDRIISGYSTQLEQEKQIEGTLVLRDAEELNVTGLLNLKNDLIEDSEKSRLQIQEYKQAIRVLSFGPSQKAEKSLVENYVVLIPLILIIVYLVFDLFVYFNRKSKELLD